MTYRGLEKFYLWSIHALLFIVPFLPLYVSGTTYFPYITGRNFSFRIIVEIAFIFWLGLIALNKEYRPRFSKLYAAVFVFAAVVFIADIFGANFYKSFWACAIKMSFIDYSGAAERFPRTYEFFQKI